MIGPVYNPSAVKRFWSSVTSLLTSPEAKFFVNTNPSPFWVVGAVDGVGLGEGAGVGVVEVVDVPTVKLGIKIVLLESPLESITFNVQFG